MRNKYSIAAISIVAIFLCACSSNKISLDYTNAKGEVPPLGNLVFRFNKSLVKDSLLNYWDSTDYVSFEPKIDGKFRWESPDQLIFSPAHALLPATEYKATVKNEVLQHSKYDQVTNNKLSFHTAPLQMTDAIVSWVLHDENSRTAIPQLSMHFNYPVDPEDLKEKLSVEVEGKKEILHFKLFLHQAR
jgi:hypothetical protein